MDDWSVDRRLFSARSALPARFTLPAAATFRRKFFLMGFRVINAGLHVPNGLIHARDGFHFHPTLVVERRIQLIAGLLESSEGRIHVNLMSPKPGGAVRATAFTRAAGGGRRSRYGRRSLGDQEASARQGDDGEGGENMFLLIFHNELRLGMGDNGIGADEYTVTAAHYGNH